MHNTRLTHILGSWETWPLSLNSPPVIIQALNKGKTNQSYLLKTSQGKIKLRIHPKNKKLLGLNKSHEQTILEAITQQSTRRATCLAPRLLFDDSDNDFALFEFIEGRTWTLEDIKHPQNQQKLHNVIEAIQKIEVNIPEVDYENHIKHYTHVLKQNKILLSDLKKKALENFLLELEKFQKKGWKSTLCHHDMVAENILETDSGLVILDWEYAGLGHPEFDQRYIQSQKMPENTLKQSQDILDRLIYWTDELWRLVIER